MTIFNDRPYLDTFKNNASYVETIVLSVQRARKSFPRISKIDLSASKEKLNWEGQSDIHDAKTNLRKGNFSKHETSKAIKYYLLDRLVMV